LELFITCPKGLEEPLLEELKLLGASSLKLTQAGVRVDADLEFAYRACLWSRLANRVLLLLDLVPAADAQALYDGVYAIDWLAHLRPEGTLTVDFNGRSDAINNTHFGALKVKDAIVDAVRNQTGSRPSVDKQRPDLRINVHLKRDLAQIAIDLSGESLHRRGYRLLAGAAPMKENLAAAILARAGVKTGATELPQMIIDPMCGSGTLLTEAAMILADIAPGLKRRQFGFDRWVQHQSDLWNQLREEALGRREAGLKQPLPQLFGYDADAEVLQRAQANAAELQIEHLITLERCDLASLHVPQIESGLIITNPPYGERLGEQSSLRFLYAELGNLLKQQCAGWQAAVFTSNPELGKVMGLRAERIYKLFNGALASQLLLFTVFSQAERAQLNQASSDNLSDNSGGIGGSKNGNPSQDPSIGQADIATDKTGTDKTGADRTGSVPSEGVAAPTRLSEQAQMLENRLRKNLKALSRWVKREQIEAYRVYDADLPEYAVAIDRYADQLVIQEYAPPASVDPVKAFRRLQDAINVVGRVFEVGADHIVLKQRKRQAGTDQYQRQAQQGRIDEVREYGCLFEVNLRDFLDTGLFLDHRPARKRIQELAPGKDVLNLFCYTATASVHAGVGGASSVTSVDMSATYLEWAERNFALNKLSGPQYQFIQADCMQWLDRPRRERFDLIFMDPPTFSNSKRMQNVLDVQRDHQFLVRSAMKLLKPDGVLIFSNNYRRFKMDYEGLAEFDIKDISAQTIDMDFKRNPKIHVCFEIRNPKS